MTRALLVFFAILLAFAAVLVVRFPASWAVGALPASVHCRAPTGTVWRGACGEVVASGTSLGALTWTLRPAALLRGALDAHVGLARAGASAVADVMARREGAIVARQLHAAIPLESGVIPQLPTTLEGDLAINLPVLQIRGRTIERIEGEVQIHGLGQRGGYRLGDFAAHFPSGSAPGGEPVGQVRDLGGPLDVRGTLRLTREPGYVLDGEVAARAGADPRLANQLRYLGNPDAAGRRPFSLAGTW